MVKKTEGETKKQRKTKVRLEIIRQKKTQDRD